jgi:hypothetical protein
MTVVPSGVSASQEAETHHEGSGVIVQNLTADRTNLSGSLGRDAKAKDARRSMACLVPRPRY